MAPSQRPKTCKRCNGAGNYYEGRNVVRCGECGGVGQVWEDFDSVALDQRGGKCSLILLLGIVGLGGLLTQAVSLLA